MKKKRKRNENSSAEQYYLETSVQIKRLLGHPLQKTLIEKILLNSKKFSSLYIFREFKEAVIVPLITFYFILREEKTVTNAINVFSNTTYSTRDLKEMLLLLGDLIEKKDDFKDKDKVLSFVFNYIFQLYNLFESIVDGYVANNSGFVNNKVDLRFSEDGYHNFIDQIKCNGKCGQEKFWRSQSKILDLLLSNEATKIYGKHRDFKKHQMIFAEIKADCKRADMLTRCQKIGDAIIAIECPKTFKLLSFDSIFEIYGTLLEKQFAILPSLQQLRKKPNVS